MGSSSDDSSDEISKRNWNNWKPKKVIHRYVYEKSSHTSRRSLNKRNEFTSKTSSGNWIPPYMFFDSQDKQLRKNNVKFTDPKSLPNTTTTQNETVSMKESEQSKKPWKWEERYSLSKLGSGSLSEDKSFWDILDPSIFGSFTLKLNEYGNIYGTAEGEIDSEYKKEKLLLFISNTEVMRKLLGVTKSCWSSLEESLKADQRILKFEAFQDVNILKMNSLEKLWFLLCKRRHLLSALQMQLKYTGNVKLKRVWKVVPKIVVEDIRDIYGEDIV